jgi:hypothetical protein
MFIRKAKTDLMNLMNNLKRARSDQNTDPRARRKLEELIIISRNTMGMLDKIMITAVPRKTDAQIAEENHNREQKEKSRWSQRHLLQ